VVGDPYRPRADVEARLDPAGRAVMSGTVRYGEGNTLNCSLEISMRLLKLALVTAFLPVGGLCQQSNPQAVNWESLDVAWQAYMEKPSALNADRVYNVLPTTIPDRIPTSEIGSRVDKSIYRNLHKLKTQIRLRKRSAVRVAFRLMTIADGDLTESLDDILGSSIRTAPKLFLQELQNHHSLIRDLEGLLNSGGDDPTEKQSGWNKEHQERIKVFRSVKDENLVGIRDECIAALHSQMNE
jgi:hypothetical protein